MSWTACGFRLFSAGLLWPCSAGLSCQSSLKYSEVYKVAPASKSKTEPAGPVFCPVVVIASLLSALASPDLAATFLPELYAADASEAKGSYTTARVGIDVERPLWRTASKKLQQAFVEGGGRPCSLR